MLLALQAAEVSGGAVPFESVSALHEALFNDRLTNAHPWPDEKVEMGGFPASAGTAAISQRRGWPIASRWDLKNDRQVMVVEYPPDGFVVGDGLYFSRNGSALIGGVSHAGTPDPAAATPDGRRPGIYCGMWHRDIVRFLNVGPCGGSVIGFAEDAELVLVRAGPG